MKFLTALFLTMMTMEGIASPNFPIKASANGRFLVDQDNQPFLMTGTSGWEMSTQLTNSDIDTYLTDRASKGFNATLLQVLDSYFGDQAPKNIDGVSPFTGSATVDFSKAPNDTYFARIDHIVSEASSLGMLVIMFPIYTGSSSSNGFYVAVEAASDANLQTWGTYMGNRYKDSPNIIWSMGGDNDPITVGVDAKQTVFTNALVAADTGHHLITSHNHNEQTAMTPWSSRSLATPSWLTLNNVYSYTGVNALSQTAYGQAIKPFFLIESGYENSGITLQQVRAEGYWAQLSGAAGYVFGNCPLWGFDSVVTIAYGCANDTHDWHDQLDSTGGHDLTRWHNFFSGRAWQNLVPDFSHAVATSGYGTIDTGNYVTTARAGSGSWIVSYGTISGLVIDMTKMSGTTTAQWYDPTNGTFSTVSGSPFANTGTHTFTRTGNNSAGDTDWVLSLTSDHTDINVAHLGTVTVGP